MAMALKAKGFRVETEADLIELLGNRLRSGREIFGMATQSMEDVPLEMRGTRRAAGAWAAADGLVRRTGRGVWPHGADGRSEPDTAGVAARAEAEAAAAAAEAAQTDLFGGEPSGAVGPLGQRFLPGEERPAAGTPPRQRRRGCFAGRRRRRRMRLLKRASMSTARRKARVWTTTNRPQIEGGDEALHRAAGAEIAAESARPSADERSWPRQLGRRRTGIQRTS
jgi:hypothetical protein